MASRLVKRFFNSDTDIRFLQDFASYYDASGEFSVESMQLERMKQLYSQGVRLLELHCPCFISTYKIAIQPEKAR